MAESSKPTITEFLLARIAEDEARARRVLDYDDPPEQIRHLDPRPATLAFYESRVLAECKAKRAIVEEHPLTEWQGKPSCWLCAPEYSWGKEPDPGPCLTICALAAVYADHPDYRQEWAA